MIGTRARVLIVDDNPEDIAIYSRWLRSGCGSEIRVSAATSLQSAIDLCAADLPDCILLDYDLRAATGLDVMLELAGRGMRTAIVAMTGSGSETIAADFMRAGAGDYLIKSQMSAENLRAAILAQLAKGAVRKQDALDRERDHVLSEQLAADLERSTFLVDMERRFAGVLDVDDVLKVAASAAVPFLADICIVDVIRDGVFYRRWANIDGGPDSEANDGGVSTIPPDLKTTTASIQALRTGAPLYLCGKAFSDATAADFHLTSLAEVGIVAAAIVPLRFSSLSMGLMTFGSKSARQFSASERAIFDGYARRTAAAIANARIVASDVLLREQDDGAKRRLVFAHRISSLVASSPDWQTTLPNLMKTLTTSFCDSAAIFSVDQDTQRIRLVSAAAQTPQLERIVSRHYADDPPLIEDRARAGYATRIAPKQRASQPRDRSPAWAPVSEISVPLLAKGAIVGLLLFIRDRPKTGFDSEDIAVANRVGRQISTHLENVRRFERERGIATALQQTLLPPELPMVGDLLFAVRYFAGGDGVDIGGDWYDVVNVTARRIVITIGDVIGSGVNAAAAMGQYRDVLRAYAFESLGPAAVLTRLNDLVNAQGGEQFATCALLMLDRETRRIDYALAGHPPPMLRLPGGEVRALDEARSMPIGAWRGAQYVEASTDMPVGATLVLYTDGLVESRRRTAADGVALLKVALGRSRPDIELMLEDILLDLAPSHDDDIAMLAIEMLPQPSASLKRWVYRLIDRATVNVIRSEFDAILASCAAPGSDTFDSRLILDELLANVVRHAPGAFRLELDWSAAAPTLHLHDNGPGFAVGEEFPGPQDLLSVSGRGLFLIGALGGSLKIVRRPSGGLSTSVILPVYRTPVAGSAAALAPAG